jgi:hypothetical protein
VQLGLQDNMNAWLVTVLGQGPSRWGARRRVCVCVGGGGMSLFWERGKRGQKDCGHSSRLVLPAARLAVTGSCYGCSSSVDLFAGEVGHIDHSSALWLCVT